MAYPYTQLPQYYSNPFQGYQQPVLQQVQPNQQIFVKGVDAAKNYPLATINPINPPSAAILWDEDVDVFYRVSANMQGSGKPNIVETFDYSKREEIAESKNQNDAILERLDALEKKLNEKLAYKPKYNKNRRDEDAESDV